MNAHKKALRRLARRTHAVEAAPHDEFGDGRRMWFKTTGHNKLVCYRRPGSFKGKAPKGRGLR